MEDIFHRHRHDPVEINITIAGLGELLQNEKKILEFLHLINTKIENMAQTLDEVLQAVTDESTVDDSIIALLNGISQQLKDALAGATLSPESQAKVDAIFAGINQNKQKVADAVTANTPSA